jgi:hypothetical protein
MSAPQAASSVTTGAQVRISVPLEAQAQTNRPKSRQVSPAGEGVEKPSKEPCVEDIAAERAPRLLPVADTKLTVSKSGNGRMRSCSWPLSARRLAAAAK